ncbi:MAG: AMP-binding protein [Thauera sp.]|nr:AMP-binding protein [Thauera sp.]
MTTLAETHSAFEAGRPTAPFRDVRFGPVDIEVTERADGAVLIRNLQPLAPMAVRQLGDYLRLHAAEKPDTVFLAEPDGTGDWRQITYREALAATNAVSQWLLDRNIPADRPIFVLSENSIHHALLQLGAMQIGIPVLAVSPAYSLVSQSGSKIADLSRRFAPALVYAGNARRYARALASVKSLAGARVLSDAVAPDADIAVDELFADVLRTAPTAAVDAAVAKVGLDSIARLLLTSGSTGAPKAVTVTQRNMIASGTLWDQCWPFLGKRPLVLVDWLPWNHTAGANGSFNMVLRHGGTLYIDDGKPMPELVDRTIANLRRFQPSIMVNVPRGLEMLVARMEDDPSIADAIFPNLDVIVYGGASLPPNTWLKLEEFSARATGRRIPVLSSLGSTETTTPATLTWWPPQVIGTIGLPAPGVEAKLVPVGNRMEIRFRGQNITTGYFGDDQANRDAFDEEGYLRTGDAVTFITPDEPRHGLQYAGRIAENFKLTTGTWVSVAHVRGHVLGHTHPWLTDLVCTGHDADELGALLFPNADQLRKRLPGLEGLTATELATHPLVKQTLADALRAHNEAYRASSTRIARALILDRPPCIDAGEITDKGHINQRGVLANRADSVRRLYAATAADCPPDCLLFD